MIKRKNLENEVYEGIPELYEYVDLLNDDLVVGLNYGNKSALKRATKIMRLIRKMLNEYYVSIKGKREKINSSE